MDNLEKREYYTYLFDFYSNILTKKQREYFIEYYFNDLSLAEIASLTSVSRNAVFDMIQKTHKLLDYYEENLKLYQKFINRNRLYDEYLSENKDKNELIEKLKEIE